MAEIQNCRLLGPEDGVDAGDLINITIEVELTTDAPRGEEDADVFILANGTSVGNTNVSIPSDTGITTTIFSESLTILTSDFADAGETVNVSAGVSGQEVSCGSFVATTGGGGGGTGEVSIDGCDLRSPAGEIDPNSNFNISADVQYTNTKQTNHEFAIGLSVNGVEIYIGDVDLPAETSGEFRLTTNPWTIDEIGSVSAGDTVDVTITIPEFGDGVGDRDVDCGSFQIASETDSPPGDRTRFSIGITSIDALENVATVEYNIENISDTQQVANVSVSPGTETIEHILDPGDRNTGNFELTFKVENAQQVEITVTVDETGDSDSRLITVTPPENGDEGEDEEDEKVDFGDISPSTIAIGAIGIGVLAALRQGQS